MTTLDVLIAARNEEYLDKTIGEVLNNRHIDTKVIVICDGYRPDSQYANNSDVHIEYLPESVGQRAAINHACRISEAEYVMKLDAHCMLAPGFDVELTDNCEPTWTVIPQQRNLIAFEWECTNCHDRKHQGPVPPPCECGNNQYYHIPMWTPRPNTRHSFYYFDRDLTFQYWNEAKQRPGARQPIVETMSLLGACWLMSRERYWELGGLDELHGSWGNMGTEVACKTWLSGGRLVTNRRTWYAHLFRTQEGWKFPYPLAQSAIDKAKEYSRWLWLGNNWPGAIYPLEWLVNRFAPVPTWETESVLI